MDSNNQNEPIDITDLDKSDHSEEDNTSNNFNLEEHKNFCSMIKAQLVQIIKNETILSDLDSNISIGELKSILSLEHGESMKLFIRRADDQIFSVIVKLDATLKDLKDSIREYYKLKHEKSPDEFPKAVNWKYVWKNYCLMFEEEKLTDNLKQLRDYGLKNKSELTFYQFSFRKLHKNKPAQINQKKQIN